MVIEYAPLEDELGDVLDKAMRHTGCTEQALSARSGVCAEKIHDAIDYRCELTQDELRRLAAALGLNEHGVLALAQGRYPLPEVCGLPFCLYPLRTPHGIGVANAYIVAECGQRSGILFDAGADYVELSRVWPKAIRKLDAIFITHEETEHTGGLDGLLEDFGRVPLFYPEGGCCALTPPVVGNGPNKMAALYVGEGSRMQFGAFEVRTLKTPGHTEAHNSYYVSVPRLPDAPGMLVSGDLIFAGSAGRGYFSFQSFRESVRRIMDELPENTIIAPGHGPLTTLANEKKYNPFGL